MSNRLVLNETSYHGKGAIQEIAGEVKRRGFKKAFVVSKRLKSLRQWLYL